MTDLEKLCSRVTEAADCAVITDDVNRRYFTAMKSSAGTLVVFPEKAYFIIDFRYIEKARKTVTACEVILQDKLYEQINELIEKHGAKTVAVNADTCTLSELIAYQQKLNAEVITDTKLAKIITEIRTVKSQEQIDKIIKAQRIAENGFAHMLDFIKVGRTEKEIQLELDYYMLKMVLKLCLLTLLHFQVQIRRFLMVYPLIKKLRAVSSCLWILEQLMTAGTAI